MPGFNHPVTVTLNGLPKEYPAPRIVVPGDQTDFTLAVSFPYGAKPAELKNIKLLATAQTDPQNPKSMVQSNSVMRGIHRVKFQTQSKFSRCAVVKVVAFSYRLLGTKR